MRRCFHAPLSPVGLQLLVFPRVPFLACDLNCVVCPVQIKVVSTISALSLNCCNCSGAGESDSESRSGPAARPRPSPGRFKFLRLRPGQSCRRAVVTGRLLSFLLRSAIICACGHHACSELRNFQLSQSTKGRRRRTRALREGSRSKAGAAGRRLLHRLRRRMISGVQHSAPKIRFARRRIPYRIDVYCTWDGRQ